MKPVREGQRQLNSAGGLKSFTCMLVVQFWCKVCEQLFPSEGGCSIVITWIHRLCCVANSADSKSLRDWNCGSNEQCLVKKSMRDEFFEVDTLNMQLILASCLHHRNVEVVLGLYFFNHQSLHVLHKSFFFLFRKSEIHFFLCNVERHQVK